MTNPCEYSNQSSGSEIGEEFLDKLKDRYHYGLDSTELVL
jgi:hypothetical protein